MYIYALHCYHNISLDTYIYNVKAEESNFTSVLGLFGECQLALAPSFEIVCALLPSRQVVAVWPLDCLRTFAYGNGVFSFEAGRHAPHGPGEYSFITHNDHLIHGRLIKLIEKAKRNSLSSSSSRLSNIMDNRPPARLPIQDRDSSSDSPASVNSDLEDSPRRLINENVYIGPQINPELLSPARTNFPPPLPDLPPPKVPPKGSTYQEQPIDAVGRYLQSNTSTSPQDESGDHVYSHTIHPKPNYDHKTPDDPQIYNSLVHDGVKVKRANNYEVAYPERNAPIPIQGSSNVVYDTAYNDTDGQKKPPVLSNLPPIPDPLGDGMTANPLYGSKGNLLEDIMNKQVFDNSPKSQSPPLPPKPKSLSSSPESTKLPKPSHPDVTANPVYELTGSGLLGHSSPPINGQTPPNNIRSPSGNSQSPPSNGPSPPINGSSLNNNNNIPLNDSQRDNIQEDNEKRGYLIKGYSKVNKRITDSFQETFIPGSMESDPPPIPERQCSFNED